MPDMPNEVLEGGIWCHEVLEALDGYVGGWLEAARRAAVEAHLERCDVCVRFGGDYGRTVAAVREQLGAAEPVAAEVSDRLLARLSREVGGR